MMWAVVLLIAGILLPRAASVPSSPSLIPPTPSSSLSPTISESQSGTTSSVTTTSTNITSATTTGSPASSTILPSLGNVAPCVTNCLQSAIAVTTCTNIAMIQCFCAHNSTSTAFERAMVDCVFSQCPDQLSAAETLAQQFCAVANATLTFPAPTSTTSSTSSLPASLSSLLSSTTTTTAPAIATPTGATAPRAIAAAALGVYGAWALALVAQHLL